MGTLYIHNKNHVSIPPFISFLFYIKVSYFLLYIYIILFYIEATYFHFIIMHLILCIYMIEYLGCPNHVGNAVN